MCGDNNLVESLNCPRCNANMILKGADYICSNVSCNFFAPRIIRRKVITKRDLNILFKNRITDFIDGFYKKGLNETFSAYLKLNDNWKITIHLDKESAYQCPLCNEKLFKFNRGYECKNSACKLGKIWDKFRDKNISEEQLAKLIKSRKTDLIKGFYSKKTGKRYDGFIKISDNGSMEFQFEDDVES